MTTPVEALAYSPYQEDPNSVPSWRKAAYQANLTQQRQQGITNSPYSASAQNGVFNTLSASQQAIMNSGDQVTANAQAQAATAKAYNDQYTQNTINYNQQVAQNDFQAKQTQALKDLQTKYANMGTAQQQTYQDWYNQYIGGNGGTGGTGSTNSGATSGNGAPGQPVNYTGQAAEIAQMARNAGFPESAVATAVAISQAESSGNATAVNNANNNGTSDYGLMQINSVHSDLLKQYNWKDPQQNMDMAYQIYKSAGGNFTPWSTFNSGAYQKFMTMGRQATSAIIPASGPVPVSSQTTSGLRQTIINKAETYIGLPYVWGGTDLSKGVDCSGLVQQVYAKFGISLPRTSASQYSAAGHNAVWGVRTNVSDLEPGDLVYFKHSDGQVHHVAIWLGKGQVLEAPYTGANVRIRTLSRHDVPYGVHLYGLDNTGAKSTGTGRPTAA